MEDLIAFNHTYAVITRNVVSKLGSQYFSDDKSMQKIDVNFGNYYFRALKGYIETGKCTPSWQYLFDACRNKSHFQFIYLALGVNAHVNNDLPQTLFEVLRGNIHSGDYFKVNTIISQSINEVMTKLKEKNKALNTIENLLHPLYSYFFNWIIQNWMNILPSQSGLQKLFQLK